MPGMVHGDSQEDNPYVDVKALRDRQHPAFIGSQLITARPRFPNDDRHYSDTDYNSSSRNAASRQQEEDDHQGVLQHSREKQQSLKKLKKSKSALLGQSSAAASGSSKRPQAAENSDNAYESS